MKTQRYPAEQRRIEPDEVKGWQLGPPRSFGWQRCPTSDRRMSFEDQWELPDGRLAVLPRGAVLGRPRGSRITPVLVVPSR